MFQTESSYNCIIRRHCLWSAPKLRSLAAILRILLMIWELSGQQFCQVCMHWLRHNKLIKLHWEVVPRLLGRIYDKVNSSVKGNKLKEWLLKKAIASKQHEIENHIIRTNSIWDKIVFKSIREGMGGKVRLMVCGSAPLSGNILEFMRCALGCVVRHNFRYDNTCQLICIIETQITIMAHIHTN